MKDLFFIAFHFAAQAIPIVLLIDNEANKLTHKLLNRFLFYFNLFVSYSHALVLLAT